MPQIPSHKQNEYATLYKIVSPDFTVLAGFETQAEALEELLRGCGGTIPAGWYVAEYHPRDEAADAQRVLNEFPENPETGEWVRDEYGILKPVILS